MKTIKFFLDCLILFCANEKKNKNAKCCIIFFCFLHQPKFLSNEALPKVIEYFKDKMPSVFGDNSFKRIHVTSIS